MARAKTIVQRRAHIAAKKASHASSRLALTNGPEPQAATLFNTLKHVARGTTRSGSRRHVFVITCYFDLKALRKFAASIQKTIEAEGGNRRTYSLFRQGCLYYQALPNMPEHLLRPLMERFAQLLEEQPVFREVFGVI